MIEGSSKSSNFISQTRNLENLKGKKIALFIEKIDENGTKYVCNLCNLQFPDVTQLEVHTQLDRQHQKLFSQPEIKYEEWMKDAIINDKNRFNSDFDDLDLLMKTSCQISEPSFSPIVVKSNRKFNAPKKPSPYSANTHNRIVKKRKLNFKPRMPMKEINSLLKDRCEHQNRVAGSILGELLRNATYFSEDQTIYLRELYHMAVDIELKSGMESSNNLFKQKDVRENLINIRSSLENKLQEKSLSLRTKLEIENLLNVLREFKQEDVLMMMEE